MTVLLTKNKATPESRAIRQEVERLYAHMRYSEWTLAAEFVRSHPRVAAQSCGLQQGLPRHNENYPLFCFAISLGVDVDVVRAFVEAGAPIEGRGEYNRTPLLIAATLYSRNKGNSRAVFNYLTEIGCKFSAVDWDNRGAVSLSQYWLPIAMIEKAYSTGLKQSEIINNKSVPAIVGFLKSLDDADNENQIAVFKCLVKMGMEMNPQINTSTDLPAVLVANRDSNLWSKLLVEHGVDPGHRCIMGRTAFFNTGSDEHLRWLLSLSPSLIDLPDFLGITPLMNLLMQSHDDEKIDKIKFFISTGANMDAFDDRAQPSAKPRVK